MASLRSSCVVCRDSMRSLAPARGEVDSPAFAGFNRLFLKSLLEVLVADDAFAIPDGHLMQPSWFGERP